MGEVCGCTYVCTAWVLHVFCCGVMLSLCAALHLAREQGREENAWNRGRCVLFLRVGCGI